jgi:hypothetical protein
MVKSSANFTQSIKSGFRVFTPSRSFFLQNDSSKSFAKKKKAKVAGWPTFAFQPCPLDLKK